MLWKKNLRLKSIDIALDGFLNWGLHKLHVPPSLTIFSYAGFNMVFNTCYFRWRNKAGFIFNLENYKPMLVWKNLLPDASSSFIVKLFNQIKRNSNWSPFLLDFFDLSMESIMPTRSNEKRSCKVIGGSKLKFLTKQSPYFQPGSQVKFWELST